MNADFAASAVSEVVVRAGSARLDGILTVPHGAAAIVLFAHGSGSSRQSPRNRFVAEELNRVGLATLLFDLLTPEEEIRDLQTRKLRFDISLLTERLVGAIDWVGSNDAVPDMKIGLFGSSTGAAAALMAAALRPSIVKTVVSRGGRPDLAGAMLSEVGVPTLLIVGGLDKTVIVLNEGARRTMPAESKLRIVPGAGHLFEEPGALEEVARLAGCWFQEKLS